jgi:hypothetical protein
MIVRAPRSAGRGSDLVHRVCRIIGSHHSFGIIDGEDFQILIEADFIVNAFEDGMGSQAIGAFRDRYFKTETGRGILLSLYPA